MPPATATSPPVRHPRRVGIAPADGAVTARVSRSRVGLGGRGERQPCGGLRPVNRPGPPTATRQNLMLPITLATLVVRSLIVGATVEEAR